MTTEAERRRDYLQALAREQANPTSAVTGPLTDVQLRADPVEVTGEITGPLTNEELRAAPVLVSIVADDDAASTTGLTDTELRATPVPVSGTLAVSNFPAVQPVSGTFWQATQPVSGTFWQATQPVSIAGAVAVTGPLTDAQLRAVAVPVSGTFFQATQPVSIAAAVAVTGTFWQATQPVSMAAGATSIAKAEDVASVTGDVGVPAMMIQRATPANFADAVGDYEMLQGNKGRLFTAHPNEVGAATAITALDAVVAAPAGAGATVSGASTAGSLVSLALVGGETTVDVFSVAGNFTGTIYFEGSMNSGDGTTGSWVSLQGKREGVVETTLVTGHTAAGAAANNIYRVNVAGFTYFRARLVGSLFISAPTITLVASAGMNMVTLGGNVTAPALTKGTQGAAGFSVQRINDAGRNARAFMLDAYVAAPLAEALQSVVQWYGNAAVLGTTQPAVVPAGKTLRLTTWSLSTKSLATVGSAVLRIRANTGGLVLIASPLVWSAEVGSRAGATTVAMTGGLDQQSGVFPEGFEFPAGTGLGFTLAGYGPTGTAALQGVSRFQVYGYEY